MPMLIMTGAKSALPLLMASTRAALPSLSQEKCGCLGTGFNRKFIKANQTCITMVSKIIGLYPMLSYMFDLVSDCVA